MPFSLPIGKLVREPVEPTCSREQVHHLRDPYLTAFLDGMHSYASSLGGAGISAPPKDWVTRAGNVANGSFTIWELLRTLFLQAVALSIGSTEVYKSWLGPPSAREAAVASKSPGS